MIIPCADRGPDSGQRRPSDKRGHDYRDRSRDRRKPSSEGPRATDGDPERHSHCGADNVDSTRIEFYSSYSSGSGSFGRDDVDSFCSAARLRFLREETAREMTAINSVTITTSAMAPTAVERRSLLPDPP